VGPADPVSPGLGDPGDLVKSVTLVIFCELSETGFRGIAK